MLDSGAFTARRKGTAINIKEYIAYVKQNKKWLDSYVNLDVMPDRADGSLKSLNFSAKSSFDNWLTIRDAGLKPIPVFHMGEDFKWLEKMVAIDPKGVIGISRNMGAAPSEVLRWLDAVFTCLTNNQGHPLVRTHGFGMGSYRLCTRYPWFSVDHTSWQINPSNGIIELPTCTAPGVYDYMRPIKFHISTRDIKATTNRGIRFDRLGEASQKVIQEFVEQLGLTLAQVRYSHVHRKCIMIRYYMLLARHCQNMVFRHGKGLLTAQAFKVKNPVLKPWPLKMIFSTLVSFDDNNEPLNLARAPDRLASYYELKTMPEDALERYHQMCMVPVTEFTIGQLTNKKVSWSRPGYAEKRALQLATRLKGYEGRTE